MKDTVRFGILATVIFVMGCTGPGKTVPLAVDMKTVPDPPRVKNAPRIAVIPFEDVRSDRSAIGRYQHYVETNVDRYVPAEGSAADQITQFVVEYLKSAGFPVTVLPPGAQPAAANADVVLTGQIESYWNEAVARLGRTELSSKNRLRLKVTNLADSSTTSTTVAGEGTSTKVIYDLPDLAELDAAALGQSLSRFLADIAVVDHSIKPKREG